MISKRMISMLSVISRKKSVDSGEKGPFADHSILMRTNYQKAQKLKQIASENGVSLSGLLNDIADIIIDEWEAEK